MVLLKRKAAYSEDASFLVLPFCGFKACSNYDFNSIFVTAGAETFMTYESNPNV